ncbi:MAG: hypothetical protein JWO59_3542 [Chloroflexi bacterium]|nr:hypothetical protein [Chloroflexota bacterium]
MSKLVRRVHSVVAATIPLPEISPIPDGSIDVHWRSGDRLFALNVPATPDQPPTCYLRGNDGTNLKGTLGEGLEALDVKWLLF